MRLYDFVYNEFLPHVEEQKLRYNAHGLVYLSILDKGYYEKDGIIHYKAFEEEIYGIEYFLHKLVSFIKSAAYGQDTMKRILLLLGPPGSSKSTIVNIIKLLLEEYTSKNPVLAAKCPNNCNPLYLLPASLKQELRKKYDVNIEPHYLPCLVCQKQLKEIDWQEIELQPISFSRIKNIGISTYAPGDPNTTDDSVLIGSLSLAKLSIYKDDTDPRIWNYNGVLQMGNRGIVEFVEILKAKTEHLNILLTASQDKMIVLRGFGSYNIDSFLISHTNLPEYQKLAQRSDTAAFRDRLFIIKIPYNLNYEKETEIIKKLVKPINHIDPIVYSTAAYFAVLSRIVHYHDKSENVAKIANIFANKSAGDVDKDKVYKEYYYSTTLGYSGISPRIIANIISELSGTEINGLSCITLMERLKEIFVEYNEENKNLYSIIYPIVLSHMDEQLKQYIIDAVLGTNTDYEINNLFKRYYYHLSAYINKKPVIDPVTNKEVPVDEQFLASIDKILAVRIDYEQRKLTFDRITNIISLLNIEGKTLDIKTHLPDLYNALKKYIFREKIKAIAPSINLDLPLTEDNKSFIAETIENLKKYGFNEYTAKKALKYMENMFSVNT